MNRNLDMSPHIQGLTVLRTIAVRRVILAELEELGLLPVAGTHGARLIETRKKMLHAQGEYERLKQVALAEADGEGVPGLHAEVRRIVRDELAARAEPLTQDRSRASQPPSLHRRRGWLLRFFGRRPK